MNCFAVSAALLLCLLQGALAIPSPNFGINVAAPGATQLDGFVAAAKTLVDTADNNINPTLTSGYPHLQDVLNDMNEVGGYITSFGDSIANPLTTLVDATSGTVATLFSAVTSEIGSARLYISNLGNIKNSLTPMIGTAVNDQLTDDFNRIDGGLADLKNALDAVQAVVAPGVTVKKSLVNAVSNAVNKLKAYLPVAIYTVESTINMLVIADDYANDMADVIDNFVNTVLPDMLAELDDQAGEFSDEFDGYMDDVIAALGSERTAVNGITTISNAALTTALDGFTNTFTNYDPTDFTDYITDEFDSRYSEVEDVLALPDAILDVNTNPYVAAVIAVLIENYKYSEFCFYKYAYLIMSYAETGVGDFDDCFTKEFDRNETLMDLLILLTDLLYYDFEDISEQLSVCAGLSTSSSTGACVTALAGYYEDLNDAFSDKYYLTMEVAETEIEASTYRMLACLTVEKFANLSGDLDTIIDDIADCRDNGPFTG